MRMREFVRALRHDAAVALIMAIARCMAAKPRASMYETRGLELIELRMS